MKRIIVLLLIILLARIIGFSLNTLQETPQDSIVLITSDQLKYANLIFVEHSKLLKENSLLQELVDSYKIKTNMYIETDSLKNEQIVNYQQINKSNESQIKDLNNALKRKESSLNYWKIGGITVSVGLLILLLFK